MAVKLILRDVLFWAILVLVAAIIALAIHSRPTGPGSEGSAPLTGEPPSARSSDDPAIHAIVDGVFPKVDSRLTLGEAFARYPWFDGQPKWITQGPASSVTVLATAPLRITGEAADLGLGSGAARVFYVAEFGLSGDGKSFRPLLSAVEVRDESNRLVTRLPDPEFILVRRVMRGVAPGVNFKTGIAKGR